MGVEINGNENREHEGFVKTFNENYTLSIFLFLGRTGAWVYQFAFKYINSK